MKDGWEVIRSSHPRTSWYKWVWDPALPPQISTFTWRALHGRTPTDCLAKSRGIRLPSRCYICQQEERNLKLIYSIVARSRLRYGLFILNGLVYLDYLMAISLSVLRVGDVCSLHKNQRRLLALFYTFVLCGKSGIQEREPNLSHKNPTWNVSLLESMLSFWI